MGTRPPRYFHMQKAGKRARSQGALLLQVLHMSTLRSTLLARILQTEVRPCHPASATNLARDTCGIARRTNEATTLSSAKSHYGRRVAGYGSTSNLQILPEFGGCPPAVNHCKWRWWVQRSRLHSRNRAAAAQIRCCVRLQGRHRADCEAVYLRRRRRSLRQSPRFGARSSFPDFPSHHSASLPQGQLLRRTSGCLRTRRTQ